jgi:hypothetical protein
MKNVYLLSENQVDIIAQKTIEQIEMSNFKKVFGNLFNEYNVQKGVHIKNMKNMNKSERVIYLEEVMDHYILELFPRTNFIHEEFDNNFKNNILLEISNHSFSTLYKFFDFLKSSTLYECGFLNTKNFTISLNEQSILNTVSNVINKGYRTVKGIQKGYQKVKSGIQKGYQTVKSGIQKGVEFGKKVVKAVSPYITKFLDSEFAYWVPGVSVIKLGYDINKIYKNWDYIKKMTFEDWAETFRSFLNGATGIIIQIVLALTGVGNIANWIANGLMLIYDIAYQGISKGNWNWYNILTSAIALVATGAAAAVFKPLKGLFTGIKSIPAIAPSIAKYSPQLLTKISPLIQSIGGGISKIMGWVMKAFTTFTTKFTVIGKFLKPIGGGINKIKGYLDEVVKGFQSYFKKGVLQNAPTVKNVKGALGGKAHFDTASISKKLLATGDKTLTKKIVGGITKLYYTIRAGDTLQKILSKFKPQGVTAEILKQLNYEHGLEIKPGHLVRVA